MALYPDNLACMHGCKTNFTQALCTLAADMCDPTAWLVPGRLALIYLHKQERLYVCICSKTVVDNGSYCIDHEKALHHYFLIFFVLFVCLLSAASSDYVFYKNDRERTKWEVNNYSHLAQQFSATEQLARISNSACTYSTLM